MSILAVFPQKITEFSAGDSCMIDGIHMTGDDSGIRCSLTYIQNILAPMMRRPRPISSAPQALSTTTSG